MAEVGILSEQDKVELIRGEIIRMSPINSLHAARVKNLAKLLIRALSEELTIGIQDPVSLSQHSEPEPDLSICKFRADSYVSAHPRPEDILLLIEVADTTLRTDRLVKGPLYAEAEIPEYWIVNLNEEQVEVYQQPVDGRYTQRRVYSDHEQVPMPLEKRLDLKNVF